MLCNMFEKLQTGEKKIQNSLKSAAIRFTLKLILYQILLHCTKLCIIVDWLEAHIIEPLLYNAG